MTDKTAFVLPAYWDRARVERARQGLFNIKYARFGPHQHSSVEENTAIDDAIAILYYVLNPGEISQDTSDGPIGMDEVDHD